MIKWSSMATDMKNQTLVNKDKRTHISSPLATFISRLLNMHILNCPPHRRKTTHIQKAHVWTPYQRLCQTHTKCCHNPLCHSLRFIPTLIFLQKNEIFTYSLATQGMWLSENTWSGLPLFSDGKICFLIQSSLLPPGYATPRQIPAVWLQNLTELKNSLITIPLKYPATLTPTNGGNANHVSQRLRGAWKQSHQYGGFGSCAKVRKKKKMKKSQL